jgi:hypothetical protein
MPVLDDIVGAALGGAAGAKLRASHSKRKDEAARGGGDVRVRVRAHPVGSPDWRHWRGALVRRGGTLRFRPWVRRWRSFDLSDTAVVGTRVRRSAADGDRALLDLRPVTRCDHLAVPLDEVGIVLAIMAPAVG